MSLSKKRKYVLSSIKCKTLYIDDALWFLRKNSSDNFIESIDISIKLSDEFIKSRKVLKGFIVLPYNILKQKRILAFVEGDDAELAKDIGIYNVGLDNLIKKINNGFTEFDLIISTPKYICHLEELYNVLQSKYLIPSYRNNTITNNLKNTIINTKIGGVNFKSDKYGYINFSIGKLSLKHDCLRLNFFEILNYLKINKPEYIKKKFIKSITLSSTMGIGINIII